jgi:hypothetical protein
MKTAYAGTEVRIIDACAYVDTLASKPEFWDAIRAHPEFDYTDLTPSEIERRLREANATITVKLWRPNAGGFSRTVAVTDSRYPRTVFYNKHKLNRGVANIVNTIVHEYVHNVDYFDDGNKNIEYGHGSQSAAGKSNRAPYWIGDLAERIYRSEKSVPKLELEPLEHEEIEVSDDEIID